MAWAQTQPDQAAVSIKGAPPVLPSSAPAKSAETSAPTGTPAAKQIVEAPAPAIGSVPAKSADVKTSGESLTPREIEAPHLAAVAATNASDPATTHTDLPAALSIIGMLKSAHIVVKGVMALLAAASVATWTIWLYKSIELASARGRARDDLRAISNAGNLAQISKILKKGAVAGLVRAAELELDASETLDPEGVKERVAIALQRVEIGAARRIGFGTGILASIGSTGPFVGLFGTVWGIMNSFIGIANSHTSNLSVVAPGIAEALLATAMGLVAAIPAVVIYNAFSRSIAGYRTLIGDAAAVVIRHVSRDLDRSCVRDHARLAAE
ncbi:MAG: tonB-system energizer ExbB [Beijerinckiaceae bacterium]|nr:tonB-system energizer ExbB [Beijerinckiaceae bacterium]